MKFEIPVNKRYIPLLEDKHRFLLIGGGRGSGKSIWGIQNFIKRGIQDRCHRFLLLRKTRKSVKESCYQLTKSLLDKYKIQYAENKSDLKIGFWGNEMIFIGLDNIEKNLKSIEGITSVLIEELTELTSLDLTEINMVLRSDLKVHQQIIGLFNPDLQKAAWIKSRCYDTVDPDTLAILNNYTWNSQLNQYYIKELLKLKDQNEALYKIYTLGQWAIPEDVIYTKFVIEDITYDLSFYDHIAGGVDFGFNNPAVFLLTGIKDLEPYTIDEVYQSGLTLPEFMELIKQCLIRNGVAIKELDIYCDSASPEKIQEMNDNGFNALPARKGKNSVFDGIEFLKRVTQHISKQCVNYIKEVRTYSWVVDRRTGLKTDIPVKFFDHAMDAIRYLYYTLCYGHVGGSSVAASGKREF